MFRLTQHVSEAGLADGELSGSFSVEGANLHKSLSLACKGEDGSILEVDGVEHDQRHQLVLVDVWLVAGEVGHELGVGDVLGESHGLQVPVELFEPGHEVGSMVWEW